MRVGHCPTACCNLAASAPAEHATGRQPRHLSAHLGRAPSTICARRRRTCPTARSTVWNSRCIPSDSPCGPSTCSGPSREHRQDLRRGRICQRRGEGVRRVPLRERHVQPRCATNATAPMASRAAGRGCGPKVDGQPCTADAQCLNQHCVNDGAGGAGICCNTACTGACRSCALAGSLGRCMPVPSGVVDPRKVCVDMTVATCGTDGRCDGTGACRRYAPETVCGPETCVSDVYTGPSTCNDSGQCIKPPANPCNPYHCNATKCFGSCTTSAQCIGPNTAA